MLASAGAPWPCAEFDAASGEEAVEGGLLFESAGIVPCPDAGAG